jgi:hypothetical protein
MRLRPFVVGLWGPALLLIIIIFTVKDRFAVAAIIFKNMTIPSFDNDSSLFYSRTFFI